MKKWIIALAALLLTARGAALAEPYRYEKDGGLIRVQVQLDGVREFQGPVFKYRLERRKLSTSQVRQALGAAGESGLKIAVPRYVEGGIQAQKNAERNVLGYPPEGEWGPYGAPFDEAAFAPHLAKARGVLDALGWPRMERAYTCISADALVASHQERFGEGLFHEKAQLLRSLFRTEASDGKALLRFQSALEGYPLIEWVKKPLDGAIGGTETSGTVAAFLMGEQGELLCAFLPYPYEILSRQELPGPLHGWRELVPRVTDDYLKWVSLMVQGERNFNPEFDAACAAGQVSAVIGIRSVEPAYQVNSEGLAVPVWHFILRTDFSLREAGSFCQLSTMPLWMEFPYCIADGETGQF